MKRIFVGLVIPALVLAGCGNGTDAGHSASEAEPGSASAETGSYEDAAPALMGLWHAEAEAYDTENSASGVVVSDGYATLSGAFDRQVSGGTTSGLVFALPEDIEAAVSGQTVTIAVVTRGGPFRLAYSTNDVGNSGWLQGDASEDWAITEFTYDVPAMSNGRGDFIGILPVDGNEQVFVSAVSVNLQ